MKKIIIYALLFCVIFTACKKDCDSTDNPICLEMVPNEACQAAFIRWFYNSETDTCQEIGYSGCSQKGFETQEACNACKCN